SEVFRVFEPMPQRLRSVRFTPVPGAPSPLEQAPVQQAIAAAEARLGKDGRLLIRKSGTEPVIRVMAEGEDAVLIEALVGEICATIETAAA
ncbi:MAG TPA: phosphoglucosamine mutase, partial [Inquilinus sp.]